MASGVAGARWTFEGFLPRSGRDRRERIARIAADDRGTVVYEAPNRVAATLRDLADACGGDRPGAVCRELTKVHETITRGTPGRPRDARGDGGEIPPRGEFVAGRRRVAGRAVRSPDEAADAAALEAARAQVEAMVAPGSPAASAATPGRVAVYDAALRVVASTD